MASLKQGLKQILVDKQHKLYEKEVASKNLTYDSWIEKQEQKAIIDGHIENTGIKFLTNDLKLQRNESEKYINDGKNASENMECQQVEIFDKGDPFQGKKCMETVFATAFCHNIEYRLEDNIAEVILLKFYPGKCSRISYPLIDKIFRENENVVLVYGDEDVQKSGTRENPWFKPDWSPDRFLSCFYFGGLVAVRTNDLRETYRRCKEKGILKREQEDGFGETADSAGELLYLLFYEMLKEHNAFTKGHQLSEAAVYHSRHVLFHSAQSGYYQIRNWSLPEKICGETNGEINTGVKTQARAEAKTDITEETDKSITLSVIIPSKDNPDVLFHCMDSLFSKTRSKHSFEIILVDNGSREENKKRISDKVSELNRMRTGEKSKRGELCFAGCTYVYHPMPFNFSGMCNLGAANAKGELLLFLNDDMEIIYQDWMDLMVEKTRLPYAGAVGAKLLYPDSDIIQHAGITNLRVGPAHKLQFLHDEDNHYFGMNRDVHNMLAVTGACLMVSKDVFTRAGGFCEELAVAFNDVDLCFTIHEMGYYNIVRNDVAFYHHESLSRGKDGDSPKKQQRLLRERDILYDRHEDLYGKDPYYNPGLVTDMLQTEYLPAYHYQVTLDMPWSEPAALDKKAGRAREDKCLVVGMECAMDIYKWRYGGLPKKGRVQGRQDDMGYYFQGYSFVIGSDNACYKKTLLLKSQDSGRIWGLSLESRYRKDIKDNLKDQVNVELTGFVARMRREELPGGVYQLGMLAEDKCSLQKLVNWSNWVLEVH